jgi:hypothetical protein
MRYEHRGAGHPVGGEIGQRLVGRVERYSETDTANRCRSACARNSRPSTRVFAVTLRRVRS